MSALLRPVDIASLAAFRIVFGALMAVAMLRYFVHGWIDLYYVRPTFFFPYAGLGWLQPLPPPGMHVLFAGLLLAAVGIALGAFYRPAAAAFCLGFTYAHLIDKTNYLNHYYLVSLLAFLLTVLPAHAAVATGPGRPRARTVVPVWMVWLLRFQIGVVYIGGALAKLNPDWLLRAQPLRIWLGANADLPVLGPWLERTATAYLFSYAGLVFDLCVVPLLLWRRTRLAAYGLVCVFHLLTHLLFPIGMFPWLMIGLTPIFFEPDWPRVLAARLGRRSGCAAPRQSGAPAAPAARRGRRWQRGAVAVAVSAYAALQALVPLRHLVFPGDLYWAEDSFRFAWQIMVMEKHGRARFTVTDPQTGRSREADPHLFLTPLQARMMATQPDMLLAFARHLARQTAAATGVYPQVHADAQVSLNGRPSRPLVRPCFDLAAVPPGTPVSAIVTPAPLLLEGLPPGTAVPGGTWPEPPCEPPHSLDTTTFHRAAGDARGRGPIDVVRNKAPQTSAPAAGSATRGDRRPHAAVIPVDGPPAEG